LWDFLLGHRFVKIIVDHTNRSKAATGKALHELDAVLTVFTLQEVSAVPIVLAVDSGVLAESVQQFVAAYHRAGEGPADSDVMLPSRFPPDHRIESHQFQHVNRFET
jgi:hypothetical protein